VRAQVIFRMSSSKKGQGKKRCSEVTEEADENIMPWLVDSKPRTTSDGKYQCRYCGLIFETLEEHDAHHRQVHGQSQAYLTSADQS
jgi:hypothetical protein